MKFSKFAKYLEEIEKVSSRNEITRLLAHLFQVLHADEIGMGLYLMQGRVAPLYESVEFGVAEKSIAKSAISAMNVEKKYFDSELGKIGDMGLTVEFFKKQFSSFEEEDLDLCTVFEQLRMIAEQSGEGSQERKSNILAQLIRQLDHLSCRYLVRIPIGALRIGFSDMTVLDAFSWMLAGDKSLRKKIEQAYHVRPDIGFIGEVLKSKGVKGLGSVHPTLFTPIIMMRAERLSSGVEIIEKIGECSVEPKYDGFRLQLHYGGKNKRVKMISRNLEDVTHMFPDLSEAVRHEVKDDDIIFEGEAIGFDPKTNKLLPFQETSQRKRKHGIEEKALEIPLRLFIFDLLYHNGKSYIDVPFHERRKKLATLITSSSENKKNRVLLSSDIVVKDPAIVEKMFDDAIEKGLEGILAKKLDGVYQAGARGWNWIKFKRSYSSKIDDTIDCLVMGYDYGKGKRTDFGIGAFLVGIYDDKNDRFLTAAKIGTGLTDDEWKQLQAQSTKLKASQKPALYEVNDAASCDVWVKPGIVMEIKADELTRSSVHTAKYALRFPRLQRFRPDKRPEDTTTLKEYVKLFLAQKN